MEGDEPMPAIYVDRALTRHGVKIVSRIHLDQLNRVLLARSGDGLITGPRVQKAA